MRTIPAHIQTMLDGRVDTLAWCARVERKDGKILGFTEHDSEMTIGGVIYKPQSGVTLTALAASTSLAVDNADTTAFLDDEDLTEAELLGGAYDGADILIFAADWTRPDDGVVIISKGTFGEVATVDGQFRTEFRSLTQNLQQNIGRNVGPECDVDRVGDGRCKVDMTPFTHAVTVQTVLNSKTTFTIDLAGKSDDYLDFGVAEFTNADTRNTQREYMILGWNGTSMQVTLSEATIDDIEVGDTLNVYAGCDKTATTCKNTFSNIVNFQGFPFVPGRDSVMERPDAK